MFHLSTQTKPLTEDEKEEAHIAGVTMLREKARPILWRLIEKARNEPDLVNTLEKIAPFMIDDDGIKEAKEIEDPLVRYCSLEVKANARDFLKRVSVTLDKDFVAEYFKKKPRLEERTNCESGEEESEFDIEEAEDEATDIEKKGVKKRAKFWPNKYFSKADFLAQREKGLTEGKIFTCTECGVTKDEAHNLKTHIMNSHNQQYETCPYCEQQFSISGINSNLRRHIERVHSKEEDEEPKAEEKESKEKLKCNQCNKQLSTLQRLIEHKRNMHSANEERVKCEVCDLTLKNYDSLKLHRAQSGCRESKPELMANPAERLHKRLTKEKLEELTKPQNDFICQVGPSEIEAIKSIFSKTTTRCRNGKNEWFYSSYIMQSQDGKTFYYGTVKNTGAKPCKIWKLDKVTHLYHQCRKSEDTPFNSGEKISPAGRMKMKFLKSVTFKSSDPYSCYFAAEFDRTYRFLAHAMRNAAFPDLYGKPYNITLRRDSIYGVDMSSLEESLVGGMKMCNHPATMEVPLNLLPDTDEREMEAELHVKETDSMINEIILNPNTANIKAMKEIFADLTEYANFKELRYYSCYRMLSEDENLVYFGTVVGCRHLPCVSWSYKKENGLYHQNRKSEEDDAEEDETEVKRHFTYIGSTIYGSEDPRTCYMAAEYERMFRHLVQACGNEVFPTTYKSLYNIQFRHDSWYGLEMESLEKKVVKSIEENQQPLVMSITLNGLAFLEKKVLNVKDAPNFTSQRAKHLIAFHEERSKLGPAARLMCLGPFAADEIAKYCKVDANELWRHLHKHLMGYYYDLKRYNLSISNSKPIDVILEAAKSLEAGEITYKMFVDETRLSTAERCKLVAEHPVLKFDKALTRINNEDFLEIMNDIIRYKSTLTEVTDKYGIMGRETFDYLKTIKVIGKGTERSAHKILSALSIKNLGKVRKSVLKSEKIDIEKYPYLLNGFPYGKPVKTIERGSVKTIK